MYAHVYRGGLPSSSMGTGRYVLDCDVLVPVFPTMTMADGCSNQGQSNSPYCNQSFVLCEQHPERTISRFRRARTDVRLLVLSRTS